MVLISVIWLVSVGAKLPASEMLKIRDYCRKQWPQDYVAQAACVDKQSQARLKLDADESVDRLRQADENAKPGKLMVTCHWKGIAEFRIYESNVNALSFFKIGDSPLLPFKWGTQGVAIVEYAGKEYDISNPDQVAVYDISKKTSSHHKGACK